MKVIEHFLREFIMPYGSHGVWYSWHTVVMAYGSMTQKKNGGYIKNAQNYNTLKMSALD